MSLFNYCSQEVVPTEMLAWVKEMGGKKAPFLGDRSSRFVGSEALKATQNCKDASLSCHLFSRENN